MAEQYHIRITLLDAPVAITRDVAVPATMPLSNFHGVIQAAMDWDDCHLHEFIKGKTKYMSARSIREMEDWCDNIEDELIDESEVTLREVFNRKGSKIRYSYDFGDDWEHELQLIERSIGSPHVALLAAEGRCPPEDVGGVWGYATMLEVLNGTDDVERKIEYEEWLGVQRWDAHNPNLKRLASQVRWINVVSTLGNDVSRLQKMMLAPTTAPEVPIMPMAKYLLSQLLQKPIKLTAKGWLPKAVVQGMHDAFSDEAYWEEEYVFDGKPGREEETRSVHLTRAVLQSAGLIKKSKETLALTKKGQAHAASAMSPELYHVLLGAALFNLQWQRFDRFPKLATLQELAPLMLVWLRDCDAPASVATIIDLFTRTHVWLYSEAQDSILEPIDVLHGAWECRMTQIARLFGIVSSTKTNHDPTQSFMLATDLLRDVMRSVETIHHPLPA